jgi:hypothetical protein
MASDPLNEMERTFPIEEKFVDHSGRTRCFQIILRKQPADSFFVEAIDMSQVNGYRFEVYCPTYSAPAVGFALGQLRQKVRAGIVTRYLGTDAAGQKNPTHDEMRGRISCDGVVVDGELLSFKDLERILTTHEGSAISIKISGSSE